MKRFPRRQLLLGLAALLLTSHLPAHADEQMDAIHKRGRLKVAVYNDFPPYSDAGKGIDVELGRALAARLGLQAEIIGFMAGEDMGDDLRNMVWKGHYLRGDPADVMLRVPVDPLFAKEHAQARIFGAYQQEVMGMARVASRIPSPNGSAAVALEVFTREKIGVETASLADAFLLGVLNGRLRENVVHFKTVGEATQAALEGKIAAVMAPRAELEAALKGRGELTIDTVNFPELQTGSWPLGMAVKVEEQELADAIAAALAELKRDGSLTEIFRRHGISHTPA